MERVRTQVQSGLTVQVHDIAVAATATPGQAKDDRDRERARGGVNNSGEDLAFSQEHWKGGTLLVKPFRFGAFTFHPHRHALGTLMRFSVRLPGGYKLMLHHFKPHREESWHDHPWDFRTFVLWGGYVDQSLQADGSITQDRLRRGSYRHRRAEHAHKTHSERGALTVVLTTPSRRAWCHSGDELDLTRADWTCQE
jgi:hypothetical protein